MIEQRPTQDGVPSTPEARGAPAASASEGGADRVPQSIAKTRHDLNNLLMAALAEVQLLMLDETTPEVKQSYDFIQEQLRGMRDLIATMTDPK